MKTFEIIFGNYEEAKEMWTNLANFLWEAFASGSGSRNKLMEEWKELGGRDDLIKGVSNSLRAILNIVTALKGGIAEIFPSPDATQLVALTKKVKEFGDMLLRLSGEEYSETELEVPVKVNPDPEALKRTLKRDMAGDDVKALQERLTSLGYSITDFELGRGYFGVATRDALKQFQKDLGLAADGVYNEDVHEVLWNKLFPPTETTRVEKTVERVSVFSSALERLKRVARGVAAAADILWKGIKFVGTVAFSVLKVLAPLADALLTILAAIGDCFVALDKGLGVSELFSGVLATIIGWLEPVAKGVRKASDALLDFFGLGKKENGTNKSLMTFSKLWSNIKGKLKDWGVWDALTNAWNRLSEAAGKLGNAFKQLWASTKVAWQNLKAAIGEKFPTLFEKTKTGAANLWSKSITAIGIGLSKAIDFITSIIQKLPAIKSKVAEFAKTAWTFLTDLWSRLEVSEKFGGIAARISNFFRTLWNAVSEFFIGGRGDTSSEEAKAEKKLSIFAKIAETLKNGWDKVSSTFKWVYNGITTLWRKIGGLDGIIDNAWILLLAAPAVALRVGIIVERLLNVDGANIKVLFMVDRVVLVGIEHDIHVFHTHVVDAGDGVLVQKHRVAVVLDKIDLWRVAHRVAAARSVFENRGHEVLRLEFLRILISEGLRFADADAVLDQVANQLGIAHQYVGLAADITEAILLRIAGKVRAIHEAGVFKVDCVNHDISLLIYILVEKKKAKAPCDGRSRFFWSYSVFLLARLFAFSSRNMSAVLNPSRSFSSRTIDRKSLICSRQYQPIRDAR